MTPKNKCMFNWGNLTQQKVIKNDEEYEVQSEKNFMFNAGESKKKPSNFTYDFGYYRFHNWKKGDCGSKIYSIKTCLGDDDGWPTNYVLISGDYDCACPVSSCGFIIQTSNFGGNEEKENIEALLEQVKNVELVLNDRLKYLKTKKGAKQ